MKAYDVTVRFTLYDAGAFPDGSVEANKARAVKLSVDLESHISCAIRDFAMRDDVAVSRPRVGVTHASGAEQQ